MQHIMNNGITGIKAHSRNLEIAGNNITNNNTKAYKTQEAAFSSLVYQSLSNDITPVSGEEENAGTGTRIAQVSRDFSQGQFAKSNNPYSAAIDGKGFFRVVDSDGNAFYTRDGNFHKDAEGRLVNESGLRLEDITIEENAGEVTITPGGKVLSESEDGGNATEHGEIKLYDFINPSGLKPQGENLYSANGESGEPQEYTPGENTGVLKQGFIEMSNTDMIKEISNLVESQRAVQMNARTVRISDQLWGMANNLSK